MLKGKKYIICDMDGTLIQSLGVWDSVDTALIEALGGGPELVRAVGPRREELLRELREEQVDMFTTVFVGSSTTILAEGHMVTPRGYRQR